MAVTKIIPIRVTIEKSVDYICNPDKTDGSLYIHSEHCVPQTAALTFQHHLNQARAGGNTIGRHLIQSFAPGETTPEQAHEIGKRLAAEILGGQYAFVMATHVDRGHIHNHFVWGAANVETHRKYHSNKRSYHDIRDASDRLCEEHGLSVIVPQGIGKSYTEYHADKQGTSWKSKLRQAIDATLAESADYDDFLKRMQAQGFEIKKGAHISFRAPEQSRFTRAKTLGAHYAEDALKRRISEKSAPESHAPTQPAPVQSIIDIEGNEKIQSSPGYKQWAAIFNLKQSAAAFNLIQQYGGVDAFDELYSQALGVKLDLAREMNAADASIKSLSALRNHLRAYGRTKDVFKQYRALDEKKRPAFYRDHKEDIDTHRAAKKALSQVEKPVPNSKAVTAEIERLRAARADAQAQYRQNEAKLRSGFSLHRLVYAQDTQRDGTVAKVTLDYFYGDQAEQFSFYRIPKVLFTDERFRNISAEAKVLYGILLDRMSLSRKNGWLDDDDRVYIIFTLDEVMSSIGCAVQKAAKLLSELDEKSGLIERKRQGLGKPNVIYVKNFIGGSESKIKNFENQSSGTMKIEVQELPKSKGSNTDLNNTDFSDTDSFPFTSFRENHGRETNRSEARREYREFICENIDYEILCGEYPYDKDTLEEILELIVDTVCTTKETVRISGDDKPADVVKSQFLKLDIEHIRFVMDALRENTTKVRNIRQYLLATLYNAPLTISNHFRSLVNHDMANGLI